MQARLHPFCDRINSPLIEPAFLFIVTAVFCHILPIFCYAKYADNHENSTILQPLFPQQLYDNIVTINALPLIVIPAKAGTYLLIFNKDSCFRRNDKKKKEY